MIRNRDRRAIASLLTTLALCGALHAEEMDLIAPKSLGSKRYGRVELGFAERISARKPSVLHLDLENPWPEARAFDIRIAPRGSASGSIIERHVELEAGARRQLRFADLFGPTTQLSLDCDGIRVFDTSFTFLALERQAWNVLVVGPRATPRAEALVPSLDDTPEADSPSAKVDGRKRPSGRTPTLAEPFLACYQDESRLSEISSIYHCFDLVVLLNTAPSTWTPAQRAALLSYVKLGGSVAVSARGEKSLESKRWYESLTGRPCMPPSALATARIAQTWQPATPSFEDSIKSLGQGRLSHWRLAKRTKLSDEDIASLYRALGSPDQPDLALASKLANFQETFTWGTLKIVVALYLTIALLLGPVHCLWPAAKDLRGRARRYVTVFTVLSALTTAGALLVIALPSPARQRSIMLSQGSGPALHTTLLDGVSFGRKTLSLELQGVAKIHAEHGSMLRSPSHIEHLRAFLPTAFSLRAFHPRQRQRRGLPPELTDLRAIYGTNTDLVIRGVSIPEWTAHRFKVRQWIPTRQPSIEWAMDPQDEPRLKLINNSDYDLENPIIIVARTGTWDRGLLRLGRGIGAGEVTDVGFPMPLRNWKQFKASNLPLPLAPDFSLVEALSQADASSNAPTKIRNKAAILVAQVTEPLLTATSRELRIDARPTLWFQRLSVPTSPSALLRMQRAQEAARSAEASAAQTRLEGRNFDVPRLGLRLQAQAGESAGLRIIGMSQRFKASSDLGLDDIIIKAGDVDLYGLDDLESAIAKVRGRRLQLTLQGPNQWQPKKVSVLLLSPE